MASRIEQAREFQERTKRFAIRVIQAFPSLTRSEAARIIGRQLLRSGTAVAANYRAACRARSAADFISKISIVTEETDETLFWLELLTDSKLIDANRLAPLINECSELLKIFSASLATAKSNR